MWTTALHYRLSVSITNILVWATLTKSGSLQSTVWGCCWEPRQTHFYSEPLVCRKPSRAVWRPRDDQAWCLIFRSFVSPAPRQGSVCLEQSSVVGGLAHGSMSELRVPPCFTAQGTVARYFRGRVRAVAKARLAVGRQPHSVSADDWPRDHYTPTWFFWVFLLPWKQKMRMGAMWQPLTSKASLRSSSEMFLKSATAQTTQAPLRADSREARTGTPPSFHDPVPLRQLGMWIALALVQLGACRPASVLRNTKSTRVSRRRHFTKMWLSHLTLPSVMSANLWGTQEPLRVSECISITLNVEADNHWSQAPWWPPLRLSLTNCVNLTEWHHLFKWPFPPIENSHNNNSPFINVFRVKLDTTC